MASKQSRPGRTVLAFFIVLALAYGLVALTGTWKPNLGLDLQGGTRITLVAHGQTTPANLKEAASIIDSRVNGSGVSEAEVATQGSSLVVVEIPGASRRDLVETVKRQAQLRFRLVAAQAAATTEATASAEASPTAEPSAGASTSPSAKPSASAGAKASVKPNAKPKKKSTSNRGSYAWAEKDKQNAKSTSKASPSAKPTAQVSTEPSAQATATATPGSNVTVAPEQVGNGDLNAPPLEWMNNPDAASMKAFNEFVCPADGSTGVTEDDPNKPLITCSGGAKFLLSKAVVEGTDLKSADAGAPSQQNPQWIVQLKFNKTGTKDFAEISKALVGSQKQFAIVLDGQMISAPTMDGLITDGNAQISGSFTEQSAMSLATSLKFGALPVTFEKDPQVELVGPSLAGNQLKVGLWAGLIGLLLVMGYCLFYYRGLGIVVIASLVVAAISVYAAVLLLTKSAGFTLSLPGIAGLIVAVGITADSFIVFFERIRDEMRDGRTMRNAVEAGWLRARNTCLAADGVSLLAAVVLYIFAAGVVKGFAFALGLATLIDLAVFFWFTHPMVSWLGTFKFFNQGHKLSGLDRESLGVAEGAVAGGRV